MNQPDSFDPAGQPPPSSWDDAFETAADSPEAPELSALDELLAAMTEGEPSNTGHPGEPEGYGEQSGIEALPAEVLAAPPSVLLPEGTPAPAASTAVPAEEPAAAAGADPLAMDDLLAELLAQDPEAAAEAAPQSEESIPDAVMAAGLEFEPESDADLAALAPEPESLDFTLAADGEPSEPPMPEPGAEFRLLAPDDEPEALDPEPEAEPLIRGTYQLQPLETQPDLATEDFDEPVEAVLSEILQILAQEPKTGYGGGEQPRGMEPLPAQPPLDAVIATIDEALGSAPAVAAPVEPAPQTPHRQFSQLDDYVVFSLSGGDYAVPVRDVAEIGRIPSITRVPNVPDFIRGITNLRGEVVPVLNLPALLGLQDTAPSARGRVLFLQSGTRGWATGLVVDEVKGIQRIQSQQLEQVSGLVDDKVTSVLRGVHGRGDRLLNILDLEQLFLMPEFRQLEV